MLICLQVRRADAGDSSAESFSYRFDREEVLLGRSESVDVRLPDRAISLVHARLLEQKGQLVVIDTGSTNGTIVDGRRLRPGEAVAFEVGARLRLGPFTVDLVAPEQAAESAPITPQRTADLARQMVCEAFAAVDDAICEIEVLSGPSRGDTLRLSETVSTVGRGVESTLRLPDADCSRVHAELRRVDAGVEVVDLGSKNGVLVEQQRVSGMRLLRHGDTLRVGRTRLRYRDPAEELLAALQNADDLPLADAEQSPHVAAASSEVEAFKTSAPEASDRTASLASGSLGTGAPSASARLPAASGSEVEVESEPESESESEPEVEVEAAAGQTSVSRDVVTPLANQDLASEGALVARSHRPPGDAVEPRPLRNDVWILVLGGGVLVLGALGVVLYLLLM